MYGKRLKHSLYSGFNLFTKIGSSYISSLLWYIETSKSGLQFFIMLVLPNRALDSSPSTSYLMKSTSLITSSIAIPWILTVLCWYEPFEAPDEFLFPDEAKTSVFSQSQTALL